MINKSKANHSSTPTIVEVGSGYSKENSGIGNVSSGLNSLQDSNKNMKRSSVTIIDPVVPNILKSSSSKIKIPVRTQAQEDMLQSLRSKLTKHTQHLEVHKISTPPVKTIINLNLVPNQKNSTHLVYEKDSQPVFNLTHSQKNLAQEFSQISQIPAKPVHGSQIKMEQFSNHQTLSKMPGLSSKVNLYVESKPKLKKSNKNTKSLSTNSSNLIKRVFTRLVVASLAIVVGVSLGFAGDRLNLVNKTNLAQASGVGTVAGVVEKKQQQETQLNPEYIKWSESKLGEVAPTKDDKDGDGLTNLEEFLLGSDPKNIHTCNPDTTDAQNLFNLIDPVTCKDIDFEDNSALDKFSKVINTNLLKEEFTKSIETQTNYKTNTKPEDSQAPLLSLFDVKNYSELDKINSQTLTSEAQKKQIKIDYLKQIQKIEQYMNKFRSYEVYDRDYDLPVHPAKYLEVSIKYNTPLKYLIAIARTESRFGSDRYNKDGDLTRPGQYKNIYSIGLTDSGKNFAYPSWESGVEGFGKWYKKFNDRGVSDCRKWKIYNPNGDYCAKIETLASEVEYFLNSK